jgi:hypothetical protein
VIEREGESPPLTTSIPPPDGFPSGGFYMYFINCKKSKDFLEIIILI